MRYFREHIARMQGYVPGEQPKKEEGYIKLNTNENPYPPSPKVIQALHTACTGDLRLYPDPMADQVRDKAAAVFGVRREQVLVGNGSDELLSMAIRSFAGEREQVVYPHPTYTLYETLIRIQNARPVTVDFPDDYSLPGGMAVEGARVTLLSNPNSPSGTMIPVEKVAYLAGKVDGVLIADEAYVDFADEHSLPLIDTYDNLIVLRSFSKSFSLAGMRMGISFADESLIEGMAKVKDSYNVNRLSIVAAEAALDDMAYMRAHAERIKATRTRLIEALRDLGFYVYPSQANFVLAKIKKPRASELYQELRRRKILVRYFPQRRLEDCLRITVGTKEEIDQLLSELGKIVMANVSMGSSGL